VRNGVGGIVLEAPPEPQLRKVVFQFALFFVYLVDSHPGWVPSFDCGVPDGADEHLRACRSGSATSSSPFVFAVVVYAAFVYGLAVYLPVGILG
jgi:putative tricarboxylic transport membrane protein